MSERLNIETSMLREAREAPQVVARLLESNAPLCRELGERLRASPPPFAVTCARGSSDNAATFAKYLLEIHPGLVTASVGPSVTSVYEARPRMRDALFLAVSQSGRSPDLLNLAQAGRDDGALTVALVNDASSPLAATCEIVLPLHAGPEKSVAATKSFIAALAAGSSSSSPIGRRIRSCSMRSTRLPDVLARASATDWSARFRILPEADNLFVVGRGVGFAVAQEAALKLKETSGIHAEAMSAAELMHGPLDAGGRPISRSWCSASSDETLSGVNDLVTKLNGAAACRSIVAGAAEGPATLMLPLGRGRASLLAPIALIQSFYPLVERHGAGARTQSRQSAAPEQGDGDAVMAIALTGARIFDGVAHARRPRRRHRGRPHSRLCPTRADLGTGIERRAVEGLLAPGFIDVQVNGGGGVLFNDVRTRRRHPGHRRRRIAASARPASCRPSSPTRARRMADAIAAMRAALDAGVPGVLGIHLEGPFINPERKGVHDPAFMRPMEDEDIALMTSLKQGRTLVTLAPERATAWTPSRALRPPACWSAPGTPRATTTR